MTLSRLFDPTLAPLVTLVGALYFLRRRGLKDTPSRRAWNLAFAATIALWLFAMPIFAIGLTSVIEARPVNPATVVSSAQRDTTAIVVLGSSLRPAVADTPPRERLDPAGLARGLGAARIWKLTRTRWVIASGIAPGPEPRAGGEAMAELLVSEGVPPERVLQETASRNTRQNALFSVSLGRRHGVTRWVVVTSALHLPRALREFRRAGVTPVGVPVDSLGGAFFAPGDIVSYITPSSWALGVTSQCLHELFGRYRP